MIGPDTVKKVAILPSPWKAEAPAYAERIAARFRAAGMEVVLEGEPVAELRELIAGCDLVLSIGGDGTILTTARRMRGAPVPTVGVNIGKLGFLAEFTEDDVAGWLEGKGPEFTVVPRMMLRCEVRDGDRKRHHYALNDAVIHQGVMTRLITINAWVGDDHATKYRADGLIVSTPVGSTAYSLSLGGPILTPGMKAFIVTPIAPHALTNRPIVIEATQRLTLRIQSQVEEAAVVFDGHEKEPVNLDSEITIERARLDFPLVSHGQRSYYDVLRTKLGWGTAPKYRRSERRRGKRGSERAARAGRVPVRGSNEKQPQEQPPTPTEACREAPVEKEASKRDD